MTPCKTLMKLVLTTVIAVVNLGTNNLASAEELDTIKDKALSALP